MKLTKWFKFKKPDPFDTVNINDLNDSFDMIDEKLRETEQENKDLSSTFKELIINAGNSNAEIVDARVDKSGSKFEKLGDRLDNFDSHLEQKAEEVDLVVERERINNIVAIKDSTDNLETADIRVSASGIKYGSAGESVRNQYKELYNVLNVINKDLGIRTQVQFTNRDGVGYDVSDNKVVDYVSASIKCTSINVVEGEIYEVSTTIGNNWNGIIFTNVNNDFLSGMLKKVAWSTITDYTIIIPKGVTKLLVNCEKSKAIYITKRTLTSAIDENKLNNKLNSALNGNKFSVPTYYEEHLKSKIAEIQKLEMDSGINGATYNFITDMHVNANPLNSFSLLERIRTNTNAYHCFYGGDSCRAFGSEDYLRTDNETIMNGLYNVFGKDLSYVLGNHDFTIATGSTWGQDMKSISINALYAIYNKKTGVITKRLYHHWDDVENKIRHIIIDYTSINFPWFLTWFEETIRTTGEGWGLCFYTHVNMFEPNGNIATEINYTDIINWICAIKNKTTFNATIKTGDFSHTVNVDYTSSKLDVLYVIWGHMHEDYAIVYNNVNFICTTCDACYNDDADVPREKGTVTEQAFDVIHINTNTKKINFIRVGAGNNRVFNY